MDRPTSKSIEQQIRLVLAKKILVTEMFEHHYVSQKHALSQKNKIGLY